MNYSQNLIRVVRALVNQMTPVVTIQSASTNGDGNFVLEVCKSYWVTERLKITIDGLEYTVVSFTKDTEIIVSGPSEPVVNFFQLDAPRFRPGTHRKVNEEMKVKDKTVVPFVYLPISTITEQTEYDAELAYIADINPFFVVPYDFKKDETDLHQTLFIEPAGAMADYFINLVLDQEDKFNRPDQTNRKEWQNFGESTRWGFNNDIFDANVSAVSLDFELNVQKDYACECDEPSGDSCLPVTIYADGSFVTSVASGGRYDYTTGADPCGVTLNGSELVEIPSGESKTILLQWADDLSTISITELVDTANLFRGTVERPTDDPVTTDFNGVATGVDTPASENLEINVRYETAGSVGTLVTNDANEKEIEIPDPIDEPDVYYFRPYLTLDTSYSTYDEGWRIANGANSYNDAIPTNANIQTVQPDYVNGRYDYLKYFNVWGHKFRFTGINGGYYDEADGNYYDSDGVISDKATEFPPFSSTIYWVIDHLSGYMFPSSGFGNTSYANNLTTAAASTVGSYNDFFVFSIAELEMLNSNIYSGNSVRPTTGGRPEPFNITQNVWSCTPWQLAPSTNAMSYTGGLGGSRAQQAYSYAVWREFYGRIHLTGTIPQP